MARLPRLFADSVPNHLIVRGNNRQDIFRTDGDRVYFHRCLVELSRQSEVRVHAYVLMSNHVHMLATGTAAGSIPLMIQRLGRRYVGYFNYLHGRTGTLWEGRYKSTLVEAERYFLTCQRYIESNPVRAGMVTRARDFRWSSHGHHALGLPDSLVAPHDIYERLGNSPAFRMDAYRTLFETEIDEATLHRIRESLQKGWVLGTPSFCERLRAQGIRRPTPLPLGRPKRPGGATATAGDEDRGINLSGV